MIELDWVISNRGVAQGTVIGMISDDVHQLFLIGEKNNEVLQLADDTICISHSRSIRELLTETKKKLKKKLIKCVRRIMLTLNGDNPMFLFIHKKVSQKLSNL